MASMGEYLQTADWKTEKHSPLIEAPDTAKAGEPVTVEVSVGKEIPHPNTTEHHISWISLYFKPEGSKFPVQLGRYDFTAHGESAAGPNEGPAYAAPTATVTVKLGESGTLLAVSYCNIHGLWESSKAISVS